MCKFKIFIYKNSFKTVILTNVKTNFKQLKWPSLHNFGDKIVKKFKFIFILSNFDQKIRKCYKFIFLLATNMYICIFIMFGVPVFLLIAILLICYKSNISRLFRSIFKIFISPNYIKVYSWMKWDMRFSNTLEKHKNLKY